MNAIMRERLTYSALTLTFILIALITPHSGLTPFEFTRLALAVFGLSWLVTSSKVFWYKDLFTQTHVDQTGSYTLPRSIGLRGAIGELLLCPVCAGAWVTLGLLWLYSSHLGQVIITVGSMMALIRVMVQWVR